MSDRKASGPSPFRSGMLHGFLSVLAFSSLAGVVGLGIHMTGDPVEAGPQHVVALFEDPQGERVRLRERRLAEITRRAQSVAAEQSEAGPSNEPNLGVPDPVNVVATEADITASVSAVKTDTAGGIRINGKLVAPGQRYSDVSGEGQVLETATDTAAQGASDTPDAPTLTNVKPTYARDFSNPENRPIVSLIIGGLGTSRSGAQTVAAIDDLPPEVTLSFVAGAQPRLIKYARSKGHEVLLEIPMEDFSGGRSRQHHLMLRANASAEDNTSRLDDLLRGKKQLYGVITHQGGKIIADEAAMTPILQYADNAELAFFQHGATSSESLNQTAETVGLTYAAASENIDTELRASDIEAKLFKLETEALENGTALGTGFAYPLTVDLVARWSQRLRDKGIVLAPASAVAEIKTRNREFQTSQLSLISSASDAQ